MTAASINIYQKDWADMNVDRAGAKYQPSNGTEGMIFIDAWCRNCARDKSLSEGAPIEECDDDQLCKIVGMTMACSSTDDPRYPEEWAYGKDGQPRCHAFVEAGQPIPAVDEHTVDMFRGIETGTEPVTITGEPQ